MLRKRLAALGDHAILIAGVFLMIAPVAMLLVMSLSRVDDPLDGYATLAGRGYGFKGEITLWSMLANSLIVALTLGVFKTLFAATASYALVFFRVRFAEAIFFAILLTLFLPLHSRPTPTYLTAASLGLLDTHVGLTVPLLASGLGVLLFRQFMRQIPTELAEAARIDGAGPVRFFIDFVMPISASFLAALFAIHFIEGWHSYLWPVMVTSDDRMMVLTKGLQFLDPDSPDGLALAVVSLLPPLLLVIALGPVMARAMHIDGGER